MTSAALTYSVQNLAERAARRRKIAVGGLIAVSLIAVFLSIIVGPAPIGSEDVVAGVMHSLHQSIGLSSEPKSSGAAIVSAIRLPRTVLGLFVGAALGVSGAALQGLFRNPLVDPQLIGVSAGGALGAAGWIVLGGTMAFIPAAMGHLMTAIAAFIGSLMAMLAVYVIGTRRGQVSVATMLLAGIAINALAGAGLGILIFASDDAQLRAINFWTLGSIGGATWGSIWPAVIIAAGASLMMLRDMRALNLFAMGEAEAGHLGLDVRRLKRRMIILPALATASIVSVSGIVGFVGLVAPHLVRLSIGTDNRAVLPCSMLLGIALVLSADIVARLALAPAELPLGVVTSLIGAPFFLWLLSQNRSYST